MNDHCEQLIADADPNDWITDILHVLRKHDFDHDGVDNETERILSNLAAVLDAAGSSLDAVVRTTIYLVDLGDFARVNEIYARRFVAPFPARATVGVAALPRGARVEIDAVALG